MRIELDELENAVKMCKYYGLERVILRESTNTVKTYQFPYIEACKEDFSDSLLLIEWEGL